MEASAVNDAVGRPDVGVKTTVSVTKVNAPAVGAPKAMAASTPNRTGALRAHRPRPLPTTAQIVRRNSRLRADSPRLRAGKVGIGQSRRPGSLGHNDRA